MLKCTLASLITYYFKGSDQQSDRCNACRGGYHGQRSTEMVRQESSFKETAGRIGNGVDTIYITSRLVICFSPPRLLRGGKF